MSEPTINGVPIKILKTAVENGYTPSSAMILDLISQVEKNARSIVGIVFNAEECRLNEQRSIAEHAARVKDTHSQMLAPFVDRLLEILVQHGLVTQAEVDALNEAKEPPK